MKKLIASKKGIVALLATLTVVAIAAVGSFAYFTASGAGTGSTTVGHSSAIQLSSPTVGDLYPGGADVPVTITIHNPGSGAQHVGTVSGTVADNLGCLGSWFVVDAAVFNGTIGAGASDTAPTHVRMLDSGTSQNVCQDKTLTINWSSN